MKQNEMRISHYLWSGFSLYSYGGIFEGLSEQKQSFGPFFLGGGGLKSNWNLACTLHFSL